MSVRLDGISPVIGVLGWREVGSSVGRAGEVELSHCVKRRGLIVLTMWLRASG